MIILKMEFNNFICHGEISLSAQPSFSQGVSAMLLPLPVVSCRFSHAGLSINSVAETTLVHEIALVINLPSWLQPRFRVL